MQPTPEPGDFVAALAAEQPGEGDRADHVDRVGAGPAGQVGGVEVQAGPEQFGPEVVGDHTGIGSLQGADAARGFQCPRRVEPARDPVPVLESRKKVRVDADVGAFRLRRQRVSELLGRLSRQVWDWMWSPTRMRSTAAIQAVQVWRVQSAGPAMSGCSAASHRPILANTTRWVSRVPVRVSRWRASVRPRAPRPGRCR